MTCATIAISEEMVSESEGAMITSTGRFIRQSHSKGYGAVVTLTIDSAANETHISLDCHGQGFRSQGSIEDVPEQGYDDWKQGAVVGVDYALRAAGLEPCGVVITKIEGLTTDTNPTIVAVAAMDAIWKGMRVTPQADVDAYVKAVAMDSWTQPYDAIPNF